MIDQLRKDYADQWCLALNELAAEGIRCEQMRAVAPWTYPSVVSMMSGLYPQQHGANAHLVADWLSTFDRRVPLLQALLRDVGYRTAAFLANPFFHDWNPFHTHFDHYDISFVHNQGNRVGFMDATWIPERMFADSVNAAVVDYFDRQPLAAPEFTYIHYMDVHGPWKGAPFYPTYLKATLYIDERVTEIYRYFMQRYDGEVLFVVTSDHGRAIGTDRKLGYGPEWRKNKASMHDFNLHIPFYILPSALVREPRVIDDVCSNVDFVPTMLDWLGIELPYPSPGVSLLPAIAGRGGGIGSRPVPVYAKNSAFGVLQDCVVIDRWKYVRYFDRETHEVIQRRLFDLAADPQETESLADEFGPQEAVLTAAAADHGLRFEVNYDELPPAVKQRLQALGYLEE
jgi:arylsulfatase A-like enzyme